MKVIVTAQGRDLEAQVDPRFGRAKYFIVADPETNEFRAVDNEQNYNAAQGAGIQAGRNVAALGAESIITGHVGPKAFSVLQAAEVKIYTGATGTVREALSQFKDGLLQRADNADVEGHWV